MNIFPGQRRRALTMGKEGQNPGLPAQGAFPIAPGMGTQAQLWWLHGPLKARGAGVLIIKLRMAMGPAASMHARYCADPEQKAVFSTC